MFATFVLSSLNSLARLELKVVATHLMTFCGICRGILAAKLLLEV
jgi:hypothetical protein